MDIWGWILLCGGGCAAYCRVLYPLDATCTSLAVKTKNISKHYQKSGWGGESKTPPVGSPLVQLEFLSVKVHCVR